MGIRKIDNGKDMKYDIGDVVKIKKMNYNDYVIYQNRIGIIIEKIETADGDSDYNMFPVPAYRIIVAGIEGKKHFVYEEEIEGKIE